jgi:hypothetical protein
VSRILAEVNCLILLVTPRGLEPLTCGLEIRATSLILLAFLTCVPFMCIINLDMIASENKWHSLLLTALDCGRYWWRFNNAEESK